MTTHRAHPDATDNPASLLFDDCPRCREHADALEGVDDDLLRRLWAVMLAVELGDNSRRLTWAEQDAVRVLRRVRRVAARLDLVPSLEELAASR